MFSRLVYALSELSITGCIYATGTCLNNVFHVLQRYGVWADWDNPYLTLDPEYEAAQVSGIGFALSFFSKKWIIPVWSNI